MSEIKEKEDKVIEKKIKEKKTKKENKTKKRKYYDPKEAVVKIIAALMAACMIFAVAATCIFYLRYYM